MSTTELHESNQILLGGADVVLRSQLGMVASELAASAEALSLRSARAIRQHGALLQESGAALIRERPLRSVLISACAGTMLVLLTGWLSRSRTPKGLS